MFEFITGGLIGIALVIGGIFFSRKTLASLILLLLFIVASIFVYFGFFNVTGKIANGSVYVGLFIFSCGVYYYYRHRSGFDELDTIGFTKKSADRKFDRMTFNKVVNALEPFLKLHAIPFTIEEPSILKIPGSSHNGIEISFYCTFENSIIIINENCVYSNYFSEGQYESISSSLFYLHACLCSSTRLSVHKNSSESGIQLHAYIQDEVTELLSLNMKDDMIKVEEYANTYILDAFKPREFPVKI